MSEPRSPRSDALVFFGITGDLAYKKIFPALQALVARERLDVPVVGVSKSGWTRDNLIERARASVTEYGGLNEQAFAKLVGLLRYVDGDYREDATFAALEKELGTATRPLHYLAIPPSLFTTVISKLASLNSTQQRPGDRGKAVRAGSGVGARVERLPSQSVSRAIDLSHRSLPGQGGGPEHPVLPVRQHVPRSDLEPAVTSTTCRSRWPRPSGSRAGASSTTRPASSGTWCRTTCCRWSATWRWRPPAAWSLEAIHEEQAQVLRNIRPLNNAELVRGQFRGYRDEPGVAPDSNVATYAALRLHIDSWRWHGVPFYRACGQVTGHHLHRGGRRVETATARGVPRTTLSAGATMSAFAWGPRWSSPWAPGPNTPARG